jgi:hypothetical protein
MGDYIVPADDRQRMNEITRYLQKDIAVRDGTGQTGTVHVHYHAAPVVIDPQPVDQNPGQSVLEKYVPYFIVLLGGVVIFACLAIVLIMIAPVLMGLMAMAVGILVAVAVSAIAVSAAVRGMRISDTDHKMFDQRIQATRPPKRK